jgi:GTPase
MEKNEISHPKTYCGYIAIMGRPNVGKSTLLNNILGQKVSITSRKPQTTRHQILGIKTIGDTQLIFVDTPGLHQKEHRALNKQMNKAARTALRDVNAVLFVVESLHWTPDDEWVFELLSKVNCPIVLAVNKVDLVGDKEALLPFLKSMSEKFEFADIIPFSAKKGKNVDHIEKVLMQFLPESPHFFPDDQITDKSPRFRIAELIREKITRILGEELPYATTVEIEEYKPQDKVQLVSAIIWVERTGQKVIVIGTNGERLKQIGIRARESIETMIGKKVHLRLWVKVKENWSDNDRALKSLGYFEE